MKKKQLLATLLAAVMVLGATACGSSGTAAGTTAAATTEAAATTTEAAATEESDSADAKVGEVNNGEPATISFYEHSDNEKGANALAEKYMELHPNVTVNVSIIANDDYDDKIKVMLSGGADVDVCWIRSGPVCRQLAQGGALYAMDDMMTANDVDTSVYGDLADSFKAEDGKTYGLCTTKSCWLLWYNKDLFDAAGKDYPINLTWEEYTNLAKELTTDDTYGGICPPWTMNLGATAVGEYLTDPELTKTKEYANYLERWYVTDKSHPSIEDMSGSWDCSAAFAEGNTYMCINGDWQFLLFGAYNPEFTWCASPLPVFDGAEPESTVGSTSSLSISANTKNPEVAFDFVKFCCYSDEGAKVYAGQSCVPCYPSDEALDVYKQTVTTPGADYVFSAKTSMEQGLDANYEELNTAYKEELQEALIGNDTIDEAFEKYKERRDEINAK